jgi:hypothetical protein
MDTQKSPWPGLKESCHLPPYSIFCAWPWGLHPNVILSQDSQLGDLNFLKLGLLGLWRPITSYANLWFRWGLKKGCSPHWKLFDNMWHAICMQVNQGDSRLLVVGNQIDNLIPGLSLGHNLCFKYPNGSCKPILDI